MGNDWGWPLINGKGANQEDTVIQFHLPIPFNPDLPYHFPSFQPAVRAVALAEGHFSSGAATSGRSIAGAHRHWSAEGGTAAQRREGGEALGG